MSSVAIIQIDLSSLSGSINVVTGTLNIDNGNDGKFIGPSGGAFPGTTEAGEWFWRSDEDQLYRRNDGDSAWDAVTGGGGGVVTSVFTRTGAVVAVASDYDASQVDNDSAVSGAFVKDALETLNTTSLSQIDQDGADHRDGIFWDDDTSAWIAQPEGLLRVYNNSGSTIVSGAVVYVSGSEGVENRPTIALGRADAQSTSEVIGLVSGDILNNAFGNVARSGLLVGEDTSSFVAGNTLYLDESTAGSFRVDPPPEGNFGILIGFVIRVHATLGSVLIAPHLNLDLPSGDAKELVLAVRKGTAGKLTAGTVVHISGYNVGLDIAEVDVADNSSQSSMPAIGILREDVTNSATGFAVVAGRLINQDTSADSSGDDLYVDTSGGFTSTKPTGTALIQKIGEVLRSHATQGVIEVFGNGSFNDLPNLAEDMIWQGDSNGVPQEVALPAGGLGFHVFWGAAFSGTDAGDYAVCNGRPDSGEIATLSERTEYTFLTDCTITEFSYNTQSGDTDTVWKIVVDSVVQATITQTAAKGTQTGLTVSITAPADVAIEMDAVVAAPNRCLLGVYAV